MAYRFTGSSASNVKFAIGPFNGITFGAFTIATIYRAANHTDMHDLIFFGSSTGGSMRICLANHPVDTELIWNNGSTHASGAIASGTTTWYLIAATCAGGAGNPVHLHLYDGTSWSHTTGTAYATNAISSTDFIYASPSSGWGGNYLAGDVVCMGVKKANSTDLQVEALTTAGFASWTSFGFDWLVGYDAITTRTNVASPGSGDEVARAGVSLVADPPGWSWAPPTTYAWDFGDSGTSTATSPSHTYTNPGVYTVSLTATNAVGPNTMTKTAYVTVNSAFVPQIIWLTPAPAGAPGTVAPTYASSIAYASVANRPAVTGTTRPFASAAALNGALSAAAPGDLVQYTGAGVLDIPGNYVGLAGRRYTGYVNIDLGLPGSANHVRFTGGGGAGLPAVGIYNSAYLRIYGGEITNPPPKSVGHDGLHVYGAGHAGDGSTHHITWWNLVVHDTVDTGIKLMPNVPFTGAGTITAADMTIADCDIEATVYMIGRDKTADTHPELGTGQHCANLADVDPAGATYPSFLRNRVAVDGYNTGLSSSQGGGSVIELGFNDAPSTISGCTLILRGNNTLYNAQQQTGGNGLNLWGDAPIGCAIPFLQHSNATGSAVCNFPPGYNRSGVVVAYGRHTNTNQNAYEGVNPWQIGPTYSNVA